MDPRNRVKDIRSGTIDRVFVASQARVGYGQVDSIRSDGFEENVF